MKQYEKLNMFVIVEDGHSPESALENAKQKVLNNIHLRKDFRNAGILLKNEVRVLSTLNPKAEKDLLANNYVKNMGEHDIYSPANAYLLSNTNIEQKKSMQYLFFGRS